MIARMNRWTRTLLLGIILCMLGVIMSKPDRIVRFYLRWVHHLEMTCQNIQITPGCIVLKESVWKKQGETKLICEEMMWQWARWWAPWQGQLYLHGANVAYHPSTGSTSNTFSLPTFLQEFSGHVHLATPTPLPIAVHIQGPSRSIHVDLNHPIQDCLPLIQRLVPALDSWIHALSQGSVQGSLTIQMEVDQPLICDAQVQILDLEWNHDCYPIAAHGEGTVALHMAHNERLLHAEWEGSICGIEGKGSLHIDADHVQGQWVGQGVGTWPEPLLDLTTHVSLSVEGSPQHVVCHAFIEGDGHPTWEGGMEYLPHDHSWGKGWFHMPDLEMARWVSPFLLGDFPLQMKGKTDVWAACDSQQLLLWLSPHDWALEGEHFSLTFYDENNIWAYGSYAWEEGVLHGSMPVHRACYEQRNRGFTLDHLSGTLRTHGRRIFFDDVEVNWCSLPIYGNVVAEIQDADRVDLSIQAGCQQGNLQDGMALLRHFVDTPWVRFPWQGAFSISPSDFSFCFHLTPDETVSEGYVRGYTTFGSDLPLGLHYQGNTFFYYESGTLSLSYGELSLGCHDRMFQGDELSLYLDDEGGALHMRDRDGTRIEAYYDDHDLRIVYDRDHEIRCHNESGSWITDTWRWGAWSGSIQCCQEGGTWQVPSCQITHPDYGSANFSLASTHDTIDALLVFQLPHIEQMIPSQHPCWTAQCTGTAYGSWSRREGIEGSLCIAESTYQASDQPARHLPPVAIHYASTGWSMEGWETLGILGLDHIRYIPSTGALSIEGVQVNYSASQFSQLLEAAQAHWCPGLLGRQSIPTLPLAARISILWNQTAWQIHAEEVVTLWKETPYRAPWITWTLHAEGIDCQGLFVEGASSLHTTFQMGRGQYAAGKWTIQQEGEDDRWVCTGHRHPQCSWVVDRIEGQLLGTEWHFHREPGLDSDHWELHGHVTCYPQQWGPFLPLAWKTRIESLHLMGTYDWRGDMQFSAYHDHTPRILGTLVGAECACLGVQWASLTVDCVATLQDIVLRNIHIQDWAGTVVCKEMVLSKTDRWHVHIPHMEMQDIRLAHVDSPWTRYQKGEKNMLRTLELSSFSISNLSGLLTDWPSFVASGSCTFYTVPRRSLFSNLMLIPTEISARIGLDISNFIPARGTILFELDQGKIELTNLLDMYSEAKRSRFYLVDTESSYIDLTGHMHVAIRMKQYNLLMKWVDLFTLTLSGSLDAPRYTLTPALRTADEEL